MNSLRKAAVIGLNGLAAAALIAVTLAFRKGLLTTPPKRGFFCGHSTIRYDVVEEVISTNVLLFGGCITVFVVIVAVDALQRRPKKFFPWILRPLKTFAAFLLGLCTTALFVEVGKASSGVLRPNFMAVCQPDVDCSNPNEYHTDYICEGVDSTDDEEDLRKSFPSGHAAVVCFMAAFLCLHLHPADFGGASLVRSLIQVSAAAFAWFASLSRVSENVHHVSDVVVGAAIGVAIAVWTHRGLDDKDEVQQTPKTNDEDKTPFEMNCKAKDVVVD